MATREKILVIRGGAIGDFILTLPAIAALRKNFPGALLEILGHPQVANLAVATGLADRGWSIEDSRLAAFFVPAVNLPPDLCEYFSKFTIAVSYLFDPEKIFQKNFLCCSNAQFIAAPHRPDESKNIHATEVYLQPLRDLGIRDADSTPCLSFNPTSAINALALHPGSGSERKNWPEEKWAELIDRLVAQTDFHLLLIGGEAEGNRLRQLSEKIPADRFQIAQNLPLVGLAQRMASCNLFIGHDSGISHLAAAIGLPGLILWGETVSEVRRPKGEKMELLRAGNGLRELFANSVFSKLMKLLSEAS